MQQIISFKSAYKSKRSKDIGLERVQQRQSNMMRYLVFGCLCLAMVLAHSETTEAPNRVVRQSDQSMPNPEFPQHVKDLAAKAGEAFSTVMHEFQDGMGRVASEISNGMRARRQINEHGLAALRKPPGNSKQPPSASSESLEQ